MAEEKLDIEYGNTDDISVLRELLHTIRGLSPVSTTDFVMVPADSDESGSNASYNE